MPAAHEMESIFSRQQAEAVPGTAAWLAVSPWSHLDRRAAVPRPAPAPRRALVCVHAGCHRMAIVRADRGRAAGKSREHEDGTERGKKNGSHSLILVYLLIVNGCPSECPVADC